jgi:hypothetical protein
MSSFAIVMATTLAALATSASAQFLPANGNCPQGQVCTAGSGAPVFCCVIPGSGLFIPGTSVTSIDFFNKYYQCLLTDGRVTSSVAYL